MEKLELRNTSFSYSADAAALKNVSVVFEKGKKYLLLGESGCGKSTLLKVLAGQYPAEGIYVNDVLLRDLPEGALNGRLILVGQQPYVFRRTVADNIDFYQTGDRDRLMAVARQCCLSDFISELPKGIDTPIDEEQRQLSGGQKARIGLARAIYSLPDVLLLDEVTSALDPETAEAIESMILSLDHVTVVHISHKPSPRLAEKYDAILTMDGGALTCIREIENHTLQQA